MKNQKGIHYCRSYFRDFYNNNRNKFGRQNR